MKINTTKSLCPKCKKLINAEIFSENNKVYMKKSCKKHGKFVCLLSSDAEYYINSLKFNKLGKKPLKYNSEIKRGCPNDCGLCPAHKQHTCIALIDVTEKCDLNCPTCYASSGTGKHLDIKTIEEMMDELVKCEGKVDVLQISGGEPTTHPEILEILKIARKKSVRMVMLNTNGLRIARDKEFVKQLGKFKGRFEIYLQFDGFKKSTFENLRGRDLRNIKFQAIENLLEQKIPITLVSTIKKGVNDDEIGAIVRFALKTKGIRGITFQPITFVGRYDKDFNPKDRETLTCVAEAIEKQTKGLFLKSDFVPLPCPYPLCCSLTYAYVKNGVPIPITRNLDMEKYYDYVSNQIAFNPKEIIKKAISRFPRAEAFESLKDFSCCIPVGKLIISKKERKDYADNTIRIVIKPFMDAYTFDIKRAEKCCIHFMLPNKKLVPFCVYNILQRKKC
jgi:hypothetical protein